MSTDSYNKITFDISRHVTRAYSTSFSIAVSSLNRETKEAIYSIYGFVRFADEIVDSFHNYDKKALLEKFESDYYESCKTGISLNPVLNSFQLTVKKYNIADNLVQAFLRSMKTDLHKKDFISSDSIGAYIYGSAEVVGLMCLKVFLDGDEKLYSELQESARKLGSAFQKVNFLRDLKNDTENLGRRYFPDMINRPFDDEVKNIIIEDIERDFDMSYSGIRKLPHKARFGVLIAYNYYRKLLKKIRRTPAGKLVQERIRISGSVKLVLFIRSYFESKIN